MRLFEKLSDARESLVAAHIAPADAALDVDLFARTILGWDRARLLTERSASAPASLEPQLSRWVARRAAHEPMAYILGTREFWGLDFEVTPSVLIPRPETELIVEEVLRLVRGGELARRIADLGTGSGCIAVALAVEVPHAQVVASDLSADALTVAGRNAARHGVSDRVRLVHTPYLDRVEGPFDVIAANPPYVKDGDKRALSRDVRHEPDVALFGGTTGLRDLGGVLDTAATKLRPGGWLAMEFGFGQEDDVRALAATRPTLRIDRVREDLQGIPRTAIIQNGPAAAATIGE